MEMTRNGGGLTVRRIEAGINRCDVARTTYQMRNPFRQFYDGVATELDAHCYAQHAFAADLCPRGGRVLDVCCGRGLLIPFLRYRGRQPSLYIGVDAEPTNARWRHGADPRRENEQKKGGWGFPVLYVEALAEAMASRVLGLLERGTNSSADGDGVQTMYGAGSFDLIVYTSSIEHMQPDSQAASLKECAAMSGSQTVLYLTCPVTELGRSGYDAHYAAHVYEPTEIELLAWLKAAGWSVQGRYGLCVGAKAFRARLVGEELAWAERIYRSLPREFALVMIAAAFPSCAQEAAYVCGRQAGGLF